MQPLVSIVIPVFNSERFLTEALDSIRNQTYHKFEVICVDDGSTDRSLSILEEYSKKDRRFHIIQQKNQYAGIARNIGMNLAIGKYIMFLDSDDIFEKKMLDTLVRIAERKNTDIIFFGFFHFKKNLKKRSLMGIPYSNRKVCSPVEHREKIFRIGQAVPWNKFFNRNFVMNTGLKFQGLQSNNDVFFSKTIMLEAERLLFLKKRFVNYRISNEESLQGKYKLNSGNFSKAIVAIYEELCTRNRYETYKESFEEYVLDSYIHIFNKCQTIDEFKVVGGFIRDSFQAMHITKESPAVALHPAVHVFEMIIQNDIMHAICELTVFMRNTYIPKKSIEYRIGCRFLNLFRIKNYE